MIYLGFGLLGVIIVPHVFIPAIVAAEAIVIADGPVAVRAFIRRIGFECGKEVVYLGPPCRRQVTVKVSLYLRW
jgi:hypothetical protein